MPLLRQFLRRKRETVGSSAVPIGGRRTPPDFFDTSEAAGSLNGRLPMDFRQAMSLPVMAKILVVSVPVLIFLWGIGIRPIMRTARKRRVPSPLEQAN